MLKDSEIRIGVNIGKASHEDRGITVYTRNILREFGKIGSDYEFVLLHYPNIVPESKFGIDNADLEPLPLSDKESFWKTIIGEQILQPMQQNRLGLDVIWHPHNRGQFIVPVGYVCTMHDILPISQPELAGKYLNRLYKKALYLTRTYSVQNADMVITGSEFSRKEIIENLDIDPKKVTAIYYGIDKAIYKPNRSNDAHTRIKATYSLPDRYLLSTGSYAPHKNLGLLVDAYNKSLLPKEGVGLVMVGPNDATGYRVGYQQVEDQVHRLGLSDKITLLPSVPKDDLVAIYSNADIFAIASLYEGFGFTPLEAMACGVPVVASNASAIPEVCGNAALYAEPHDVNGFAEHFNSLIFDENLKQRLITFGRTQVKKYDWQTTARKTLDMLHSVAISRK